MNQIIPQTLWRSRARRPAGSARGAPGPTSAGFAAAAGLYANLALLHSNLHRLEEAAAYARRSVEISRLAGHEGQLAKGLGVLSNAARFAGDLDRALHVTRESKAIAERNADPQNAESVLHLCTAVWREGLILGELNNISFGRPREAEPLLQQAFDLPEARKDPHDYTSRFYVSMTGRELGDVLRDTDPARSLEIYDRTCSRLEEIKNNRKAWPAALVSWVTGRCGR